MNIMIALPSAHQPARNSRDPDAARAEFMEVARQFGQLVCVQRGQVCYREGESAKTVFILASGMVRCSMTLTDARRQIVGFHEAGDVIGLTLAAAYLDTAEAVTQVEARSITRDQFARVLDEHPHFRACVISWAFRSLGVGRRHVLVVGRMTARERVGFFLLERTHGKAGFVELRMSRSDVADYLGLTIETVSRTMTHLRSKGAIRTTKNCVEVIRPDQLQ
jgi:CRP/FNR family transcriptional regulator, anaerobic regulatory protein